jgi:hypothetical protein
VRFLLQAGQEHVAGAAFVVAQAVQSAGAPGAYLRHPAVHARGDQGGHAMTRDPRAVWREGNGQSKMKTIRTIWPALAEALDGHKADEPAADPQPLCEGCGLSSGRMAIGRADDSPVCGYCCATRPYAGRKLTRVTEWRARTVKPT